MEPEQGEIDRPERVIVLGKELLRGVSRRLAWPVAEADKPCPVYVLSYYKVTKADERKNSCYGYAASLAELALKDPADKRYEQEFKNYLTIVFYSRFQRSRRQSLMPLG